MDSPKSSCYIHTRTNPAICTRSSNLFQESEPSASFPIPVFSNAGNVDTLRYVHPEVEFAHRKQTPLPKRRTFGQISTPFQVEVQEALIYKAIPYIAIAAGVVLAFFLYKKCWKTQPHNGPIQPRTKEEHLGVIKFTPVGQKQIRQDERPAARARPNEGLKTVFGIANAFTTRDQGVHAKFVSDAKKRMQKAIQLNGNKWKDQDGDWNNVRALAQCSVGQILSQPEEKLRIVDLVRVVTLKVSLRIFFNASDKAINSQRSMEQLVLIGQRINDLWIASKDKSKPLPEWHSESNTDIHEALLAVCEAENPDEAEEVNPLKPEKNPMDWLLPAYETMWRVVLACVIELRFRNAENATIWCKALEEYVSDTSREKFKGTPTTPGVRGFCVNDIVKEALRLYPPTRRVYRRFTEDGEDVKADIEFCHRSNAQDAFGPDPLCFRPERWLKIRAHLGAEKTDTDVKIVEGERGFMPFAVVCPAGQSSTQAFGLKMIALLAGVLCEGLDKFNEWVLEDQKPYQDLTKPLPSDRAAFDKLYLIKRN
ncbi:hypothetical protein K505DRAFT_294959 [Melanomma pulvis-pyrius CBS 109.77]|uniref:Cytochrome P450 n=1 Tax=Melanomma pulvis-pyrius CBS 109.77 TaxID=1314802 RepID=A0A6A6XU59_9PLEO|nr:hypothetical protein K505DRAFT_294959 [Melanomma pulvis-pyrius CBS 109.77]